MRTPLIAVVLAALLAPACSSHKPPAASAPVSKPGAFSQVGMASWYGPGFAGRPTASGEKFNPDDMTCAHPKLEFGTRLAVTNLENGKAVVVRVNDRGPFAKGRVLDVSKEAARRLGFLDKGVAKVRLEVVSGPIATTP